MAGRGSQLRLSRLLTVAALDVLRCHADGVITSFLEKSTGGPGWINGGVYMLNRNLFTDFPMPAQIFV